jgi:hypothetical protein
VYLFGTRLGPPRETGAEVQFVMVFATKEDFQADLILDSGVIGGVL